MKNRLVALAATLALAGSALSTAPANAGDRTCRGTLGAITVSDNLVVPAGATCTLKGTKVKGDIKVKRNASLIAGKIRVDGNIQAENHKRLVVQNYSRVDGNIQAKQGGGGIIRTVTVDGDIQLFSNKKNTRFFVISNRVDGNLQCKSNSPVPTGSKNVVKGNKEGQCKRF
ncbi:polymer-forming cytoskeletal protein [Kytococcus sedentarius]|uniref:polymer-forming cytoskeletal protein n=1 Tax=Kytococcus sedentarius TaxID=1276 RepID=UPI0035BC26B3